VYNPDLEITPDPVFQISEEKAQEIIETVEEIVQKKVILSRAPAGYDYKTNPLLKANDRAFSKINYSKISGITKSIDALPYESFNLEQIEMMIELDLLNIEIRRLIKRLKDMLKDQTLSPEVRARAIKILMKVKQRLKDKRERFARRRQTTSFLEYGGFIKSQ
jgi:hypothetical protein